MKATELKIGDRVFHDGEPVIIAELELDMCSLWDKDEDFYSDIMIHHLSPIPLTSEILEKNGWKWDACDLCYACEYCPHIYIDTPDKEGVFELVDATGEHLANIRAVHELQHILWALGMDDDLKI